MKLRDGKAGANVLDRSVFKRISAAGLRKSRVTMSADPVTFPVSEAGYLAVIAAVNALSAEKIMPESFRPVILLPPGTEEQTLRNLSDQISRACIAQGLTIEGGHTEVTRAVTRPVVIGACTGIPMDARNDSETDHSGERCAAKGRARIQSPGEIIMTKWAGMEGSCILAIDREEALREVFPGTILMRMRGLLDYLSVKEEALLCAKEGADYLTDLSEGGIYAALHRLSVKSGRGFRIDLTKIPLLQETIEFANHYDLDPYKMKSMGSLLAVTGDADGLIGKLAEREIPAVKIGELTDNRDKILINGEEIRYLDLPQPDELLKIMEVSINEYAGRKGSGNH